MMGQRRCVTVVEWDVVYHAAAAALTFDGFVPAAACFFIADDDCIGHSLDSGDYIRKYDSIAREAFIDLGLALDSNIGSTTLDKSKWNPVQAGESYLPHQITRKTAERYPQDHRTQDQDHLHSNPFPMPPHHPEPSSWGSGPGHETTKSSTTSKAMEHSIPQQKCSSSTPLNKSTMPS